MNDIKPHIFVLGPGYTARVIMQELKNKGWKVSATYRDENKRASLTQQGYNMFPINMHDDDILPGDITHLLVSIAPAKDGDSSLEFIEKTKEKLTQLKWVGYLSSTNVYGNHDGAWVDENSLCQPSLDRGKRRLISECGWHDFCNMSNIPFFIFRLAGIYGPGRNALRSIITGKAKRIIKKGQVFSRIHVEDICQAVLASMQDGLESSIFNLADDHPCPPEDVILHAAELLNMTPPEAQPFETADLSPMARSFYSESKRVRNQRIKDKLGISLKYPDYISGLSAMLEDEKNMDQASSST